MKNLIFSLSLILFTQCKKSEKEFYITPELQIYYDNFIQEAHLHGIEILNENLVMKVESDILSKYGGNGVTIRHKGQISIYIDIDYFTRRGTLIEMTVFHEMGHAKLNLNHNNGYSLMNSEVIDTIDWRINPKYREYLIDELFSLVKG